MCRCGRSSGGQSETAASPAAGRQTSCGTTSSSAGSSSRLTIFVFVTTRPAASRGKTSAAPTAAARRIQLSGRKLFQQALLVGLLELREASERTAVDHDLGKRHVARERGELAPAGRILGEVDLFEREVPAAQQVLRPDAAGAGIGRVDRDAGLSIDRLVHPDGPSKSRGGRQALYGRLLQDRGDRAPVFPAARGRSDRPSLYLDARPSRRRG